MSSVCFSVPLGLILTANLLLKELSGLPIPTTPLPLPPGRFLPQPFDKDGYDYPGKNKYPRNWGPPPPELYNPNTFKEQDPRSMIETNNVQPDFGNNYYTNYEPEGYYPDEDYFIEEEETNYDSMYSGENSYESSQMSYAVEPNNIYGNPYVNNGYPMYMGNDFNNPELEYELELELEAELDSILEEVDVYADDDINDMVPMMPPPTQPPPMPPSNGWSIQKPLLPPPPPPPLTQKPLPPPMQQQIQQMQQQAKQMAAVSQVPVNPGISDNDSGETDNKSKSRERLSKSTRSSPSPSAKPIKEVKPVIEEPIEPREIELFSRTTTITKTTTWYINSDNEIVVSEVIDTKPTPLKGKYVKTSKTTTSGPVPWYLQAFEDIIFEEENGKSKTILDKMSYLKNMNPTSITSYTTAPNPWSTEVHEEVVFEEVPEKEKKESQRNEPDINGHYSHSSPLEHIVDYLPRSQLVPEEVVEVIEKVLNDIKEEEIILEEIFEEEIIEMVPPYQISTQPPKPYLYPQQSQEEMFMPDYRDYNSMNPNQMVTPKALPPPPPSPPPPPPSPPPPPPPVVDNNFTPQPYPRDPYQGPSTPAPSTPHPSQQPFSNHPQQPNNHPQPGSREHPGNNRDIQQQRQAMDQPQEAVSRHQQQRGEAESQRKLNSQIEAKRQLYQSRQQQQQQLQQQQQQQYPNRANRPNRDL